MDLSRWTLKDLRKMAKYKNVKYYCKYRKHQLVEILEKIMEEDLEHDLSVTQRKKANTWYNCRTGEEEDPPS